jgi:hypothetical protein
VHAGCDAWGAIGRALDAGDDLTAFLFPQEAVEPA